MRQDILHGLLPDYEIRRLAEEGDMISPFSEKCRVLGTSVGLSSFGYDVSLGYGWARPVGVPLRGGAVDVACPTGLPKYNRFVDDCVVLDPGLFILAESAEVFCIPNDVLVLCQGKSTWARLGISAYITTFDPGWRGRATIEISNHSGCPVILHAGQGIAKLLFIRGAEPDSVYGGVYQDQEGVSGPSVL